MEFLLFHLGPQPAVNPIAVLSWLGTQFAVHLILLYQWTINVDDSLQYISMYVPWDNHEIHSPVLITIRHPIYYTNVRFGFVYFSSSALVLALETKVHKHFYSMLLEPHKT